MPDLHLNCYPPGHLLIQLFVFAPKSSANCWFVYFKLFLVVVILKVESYLPDMLLVTILWAARFSDPPELFGERGTQRRAPSKGRRALTPPDTVMCFCSFSFSIHFSFLVFLFLCYKSFAIGVVS